MTKISELLPGNPAAALDGSEAFHVAQPPTGTKISKAALVSQLRTYIRLQLAVANGFASLNSVGKVPASQLDDNVFEYANLAAFPGTGVEGVIYIALDTDLSYVWDDTGSVYVLQAKAGTLPSANIGLKTACRLVAISNVDTTTGGVVSIDGVNTATGYRILLTNQTGPANNGIWVANSAGAWTRALDSNTVFEIRGSLVMVWQGATYGSSLWFTTFKQGNTLGSTAMNWYQLPHYGNLIGMIDTLLGGSGWQGGGYTDEQARDAIGAALVAGSGISISVNDAGDTITISGTGSYTDEMARDAIGAALTSGAGIAITVNDAGDTITVAQTVVGSPFVLVVACSDETTALTAGTAKVTFRMPAKVTLTDVRASVTTAPTGGTLLTVDINEAGASILSTKLTFDASEKTTTTAATPRVISDTSLADDAEMTIDIDAIGSTIAGTGLKVTLIGTYAA